MITVCWIENADGKTIERWGTYDSRREAREVILNALRMNSVDPVQILIFDHNRHENTLEFMGDNAHVIEQYGRCFGCNHLDRRDDKWHCMSNMVPCEDIPAGDCRGGKLAEDNDTLTIKSKGEVVAEIKLFQH